MCSKRRNVMRWEERSDCHLIVLAICCFLGALGFECSPLFEGAVYGFSRILNRNATRPVEYWCGGV